MNSPVQYLIRRPNDTYDLRTIARNVRGTNAAVIEAFETDPAIKVTWENVEGSNRVTGMSIPRLSWAPIPDLTQLPTWTWAMEQGIQDNIPYNPIPTDYEVPLRGDFDELEVQALERQTIEAAAGAIAETLDRLLLHGTAEVEPGAGNEPPFQSEDRPMTPTLQRQLTEAAQKMFFAVGANGYAVPADSEWDGDYRELFTYLSMTTFAGSIWRQGTFEHQPVWVPIAVDPVEWPWTLIENGGTAMLEQAKSILGSERWAAERAVLGLSGGISDLWATHIDDVPDARPSAEAEDEVRTGDDIGFGKELANSALQPDDLLTVKEVIAEALRQGFSKYLALKAMGGDKCKEPPFNFRWTVYYDGSRRRFLDRVVLNELRNDLTALKGLRSVRGEGSEEAE